MVMQRRVLVAIMTVTTIVVLLFAVPLGFVVSRVIDKSAVLALEHRADLAAKSIDLTNPTDEPDGTEFPAGPEHFALYSPQGTLRVGTGPKRLDATALGTHGGNTVTQHIHDELVTAVPIVSGENLLGFVRVSRSLNEMKYTTVRALAVLAFSVLAVLLIGWVLARRLAQGIAKATVALREAAVRLGSGDFTVEVPAVGIAELDDIADAISLTAGELDQLVARERSFSADTSHQLRTPIAGMRTSLETELVFPRADHQIIVNETLADLARLEQTVTDLLTLARTKRNSDDVIDVAGITAEAHHHWIGVFAQQGRPLILKTSSMPMPAYGQTALLRQAFDALLDNALTHGRGRTTIEVRRGLTTDIDTLTIAISDQGPGFLNPSSKTVTDNGQPGLGLPLTRRLLEAQGGRLIMAVGGPNPIMQIILRTPKC
jgi:signal transduction histidine kinase